MADMFENEMSDFHRSLDESKSAKGCEAHQTAVVPSLKKLLRICESMHKKQMYVIGLLVAVLVQGLLKGTSLSGIATDVLKIMIATATGGTP
jgi:hypothetical protein